MNTTQICHEDGCTKVATQIDYCDEHCWDEQLLQSSSDDTVIFCETNWVCYCCGTHNDGPLCVGCRHRY